jgi:hypothetical protein
LPAPSQTASADQPLLQAPGLPKSEGKPNPLKSQRPEMKPIAIPFITCVLLPLIRN